MDRPTLLEENQRLRKTLRDLVELAALPSRWLGLEPEQLASSLADFVLSTLSLELCYVRLPRAWAADIESAVSREGAIDVALVREALEAGAPSGTTIPHPQTRQPLSVASIFLRFEDDHGLLAVASDEPGFPMESDLLFLEAVSTQVVDVLRESAEHRRAQLDLRSSDARTRSVLETALDCIVTMNHEGKILEFNPAAEATFGIAREDAVGRDLADLMIPEELRERHRRGLAHYLATGEGPLLGKRVELYALRSDGTRFPVELAISPTLIGGPPLFTAYLRDISQRTRTERHRNARLVATQHLAVATTLADAAQGLLQAVCEGLEWDVGLFWALDPGDEVLRRVATWHHGDMSLSAFAAVSERSEFRLGEGLPGAAWAEGRPVWLHDVAEADNFPRAAAAALEDLHGAFACDIRSGQHTLGVLEFFSREIEEPDPDLLETVSTLAGSMAQFMERERLLASLRDNDRRKDEFLATLAHELRNPLAPIRNSLQVLEMERVDAKTAARTRKLMERQVQHLVRLVDDLLDVSRVMRGKIELRKEQVELADVVARAVETAQPLIEAQRHELELALPHDSLLLEADPVRLAQVVGNLLTNAAKYSDPESHIWLSAERDGDEAVLRVRDEGIGIAPDILPHVFELFVQADHATSRSEGGLGLGLTLVKNLLALHGGSVTARSSGLGEGSEFIVRLPLSPAREAVVTQDHATATVASTGVRLLVVDDNEDAATTLGMLLELQGHDVRVVHDGPAALESVSSFRPALVLLDLGMPGMDGYEVARRIRATPDIANTTLAALTGWGQDEDRRRTAEAGFDHHLVKPLEPQALAEVIAEL